MENYSDFLVKETFQSTKVIDGFSTCFRQWKAEETHCRFLHGYAVSFKFIFEGELDQRNWVVDFGSFKRSKYDIEGRTPKEWLSWLLDHTTIIAYDDPEVEEFQKLADKNIIQLRMLPATGCEKFAQHVYGKFAEWTKKETDGKCRLVSVECREHEKNSAVYSER